MNAIQCLLEDAGERGMSIRQLKKITGISKNNIKRMLYSSMYVTDVPPQLHGSLKQKIQVYRYQASGPRYIDQRLAKSKKVKIIEKPTLQKLETTLKRSLSSTSSTSSLSSSDDSFEEINV